MTLWMITIIYIPTIVGISVSKRERTILQIYTVSFFGHRSIVDFDLADKRTEAVIESLIREREYVDFLVGRDGDYDQIVSSAFHRVKRRLGADNCSLSLILPYKSAEIEHNLQAYERYYDSIEICEAAASSHPKNAITIRNKSMIERSNLCVFYVAHNYGGAWRAMQYAKKTGKQYLNLC